MLPALICLPVAENGKRYPARRYLVPSLRQPLNPLQFPSNPYFHPPKCLYFRVVSGLHLLDVLLALFALLVAENEPGVFPQGELDCHLFFSFLVPKTRRCL